MLLKSTGTAPETLQIQSLSLNFEGSGQFDLVANRTIPRNYGFGNSIGELENLTLKDYDFSLHCGDPSYYFNFFRLQTLELINCANVGYLFNKMLLNYKDYNLKKLRIQESAFGGTNSGYYGREKLEQLLVLLNTGLEELKLINLGAHRPSLPAITAQGLTLQKLAIHESQDCSSVQSTTLNVADIKLLSKRCSHMQHLSVDLGAKNVTCTSATADVLRRFASITRLEIALPPRDQSTIRDRASALAIFANVASQRLRRLDLYSASSCNKSDTQQEIYKEDLQHYWSVDRAGKDVVAIEVTDSTNSGGRKMPPA